MTNETKLTYKPDIYFASVPAVEAMVEGRPAGPEAEEFV